MASQATLTVVNALTKEIYQGKIREQLQDEIIGLKRLTRSSAGVSSEVGGKYVTFPIRVSRNSGIGYRQEDETLQDPGTQGYARVTRVAGSNPFIAYAVINDGGQPGERTGDGAFVAGSP